MIKRNRRYPHPIQAMLTLLLLFLLMGAGHVLILLAKMGLNPSSDLPATESQTLILGFIPQIIIYLIAYMVIIAWCLRQTKIPWKAFLPFRPFPPLLCFAIPPLVFALTVAASETDNIIRYFMEYNPVSVPETKLSGMNHFAALFFFMLLQPLMEQILFLGIFLRGFLTSFRPRHCMIMLGLLYALYSVVPNQYIAGFCLMFLCGWFFIHTRSIWPGLLAHVLFNSIPQLLQFHDVGIITGYNSPLEAGQVQFHPLWFDLSGAGALAIGLIIANIALGLNQTPEQTVRG